jgi:hypothetical protein
VAPIEVIRPRPASEPTTGRENDARQTEAWLSAPDDDVPVPDLEVANTGSVIETARAILAWSGWLDGAQAEP